MDLIIFTGVFSGGLIPLIAALGKGINLIIALFRTNLYWNYWECAAVGLVFISLLLYIHFGLRNKDSN
jgi:hypothetical protein